MSCRHGFSYSIGWLGVLAAGMLAIAPILQFPSSSYAIDITMGDDDTPQDPVDQTLPLVSVCPDSEVWFADDCRDPLYFGEALGLHVVEVEEYEVYGYAPASTTPPSVARTELRGAGIRYGVMVEVTYRNGSALLYVDDVGSLRVVKTREVSWFTHGQWSFVLEAEFDIASASAGLEAQALVGPTSDWVVGEPSWWEMRGQSPGGSRTLLYGTDYPVPVEGISSSSVNYDPCDSHAALVSDSVMIQCREEALQEYNDRVALNAVTAAGVGVVVTLGGLAAVYASVRAAPAAGAGATTAGTNLAVAAAGAVILAVSEGVEFASSQLDSAMEAAKTSLDQRNATCDSKSSEAGEGARMLCTAAVVRAHEDGVVQIELPVPSQHGECPIGTRQARAGTPIQSCVRTEVTVEWEEGEQMSSERRCRSFTLTRDTCVRPIEL